MKNEMIKTEFFKIETTGNVTQVKFNRQEKANSLHMPAWDEMKAIFEYLDKDGNTRVIILSGEGSNFCAGIDLETLMDIQRFGSIKCEGRKREAIREFIFKLQDCISSIEKCRKPVIAAIHKACVGGGLDIVTTCDMRFSTDDAYFSIKEIDLGLVADIGTLQRLPNIVSPGLVAEMAFTGRNVMGKEAEKVGLVNQSFHSKEEMMDYVSKLAETIAEKSPLTVRGTKEMLLYKRDHGVSESLHYMAAWNASMLISDDLTEAFQAFMEKRKPNYKD